MDAWPTAQGRYYVVRGGSWWRGATRAPRGRLRRSGSSAGTPTAPTCGSSSTPTSAVRAGSWSAWSRTAGCCSTPGSTATSGLSGRVTVRADGGTRSHLVLVDRPVLRVPQLAIHLDREVGTTGLKLNPQQHLAAVWGVGTSPEPFAGFIAGELGVDTADVLGWELMTHDLTPSRVVGRDGELVSAPRMDNQVTCFAGTTALLQEVAEPSATVRVLALFDHEEVGSVSDRGAASPLLETVLERIVLAAGGNPRGPAPGAGRLGRRVRRHGPRHAPQLRRKHEPQHQIAVNGGPVLKVHPNLRYATDAPGAAAFALAASRPACRCSGTSTAPTCPAGPRSAHHRGRPRGRPRWTSARRSWRCTPRVSSAAPRTPAMYVASLAAFLSPAGCSGRACTAARWTGGTWPRGAAVRRGSAGTTWPPAGWRGRPGRRGPGRRPARCSARGRCCPPRGSVSVVAAGEPGEDVGLQRLRDAGAVVVDADARPRRRRAGPGALTVVPAGVWVRALASRLATTWCSRAGSPRT